VKYIALPGTAYEKIKARFEKTEKGSAFLGQDDVAVPIGEILDRAPVP